MFSEYGAADKKLSEFSDKLCTIFEDFLNENNVKNPVEIRAITNFVSSGLLNIASEKILKFALNKRKAEKN